MTKVGRVSVYCAALTLMLVAGRAATAQTVNQYYDRTAFINALAARGATTYYNETFGDAIFDFGVGISSQAKQAAPGDTTLGVVGGRFVDRVQPAVVTALQPKENTTISFLPTTFTYGWGADFDLTLGGQGSGIDIVLNYTNGNSSTFADAITYGTLSGTGSAAGTGFYGVIVAGSNLSSLVLDGGSLQLTGSNVENYAMDNMIVVVPEASTVSLAAIGSLGLVGTVIRRRRTA